MKNVLVVDDDRNMNELVSRVLKSKLKCKVNSVYNGIDAFIQLNNEKFDLVILDISMPLIHGVEILEIMKSDPAHKHIPVAMMTANREKEVITKLISLGILDFIAKPISLDVVYDKLNEIIKKIENVEIKPETVDNSTDYNNNKVLIADIREDFLTECESSFDGFSVQGTDSGLEALKYFIKEKPKFVYLGKNLPIVNEKLLIKTFRSLEPEKKLKIISARESTKLTMEEQRNIDFAVELKNNSQDQVAELKNIIKN